MGHHQLPRCLQVVVKVKIFCQLSLPLHTQDGNAAHCLYIGREIGSGNHLVHGLQTLTHILISIFRGDDFSTLSIRVLIADKFPKRIKKLFIILVFQ
jgi:hypothetical protein